MWLGHVYYTLGLIPLLMSLAVLIKLSDYNRVREWYFKFEEITKSKPKKTDFRSIDEYNIYAGVSGVIAVDFIWSVLGLLTQSWYVFLSLLIMSLTLNIIRKSINISTISSIISSIILFTKFSVYLYLIINHFHLHYDTWQLIKGYL